MFLFARRRNYQQKNGYFFIFLTNLVFLMLLFFLMNLIFPVIATAQNGTISGYVYKYSSSPPTGLEGVTVTAYDNSIQGGSDVTDSNGKYTITGLSTGENDHYYRVCATISGYIIECYQKPDSSCSGRNCGFLWIDPNNVQASLVDLKTKSSATGINFYLVRGGEIEVNISGAKSEYAYNIVFEGEINYKNRDPLLIPDHIPNLPIIVDLDNNKFYSNPNIPLTLIPPGNYTLKAQDIKKPDDPPPGVPMTTVGQYYTTVYYDGETGSYNPQDAITLAYPLDQHTEYTANITIKKGGIIGGLVMEWLIDKYEPMNNARILLTENSLELSQNVKSGYEDLTTGQYVEGGYIFWGLPPGTYILMVDDEYIAEPDSRFYLPEYYYDVYFEDEATPIVITEGEINDPNYKGTPINFALQKCPTVKGWVIDYEPNLCNSNLYDINKALPGIIIEMVPNFQGATKDIYFTETDPNGRYLFKESDKLLPGGSYTIKARDSECNYFSYEMNITVDEPDSEYIANFCLEGATGSGQMTISGHVFRDENPNLPLSGVSLVARNLTNSDLYYETTNAEGEFLFDSLDCGEYNIAAGGDYEDLIQELYKGVCLLDPNEFDEGKNWSKIYSSAANMLIYPGENITGIEIGLSSYKYTFRSGLNLFGYPGLPVEKYDYTNEFCLKLGSAMSNFRGKDPDTGVWYVVTTSNLQNNPKELHTGQGYIIYMKNQPGPPGPIFFPPFKTVPPKFYQLNPGKNFIAYPSSLHRPIKRSSDLLNKLGTREEVASVKSFDNISGKWKSTVWLWNKPGAADFPVVQGEGYIAEMWVSKEVETDEPNI